MEKTRWFSYRSGKLPKGCQLCVKGRKLVLFVTGLCPRACFYCSVSDEKYHKDVSFANERPVNTVMDVIAEARVSYAKGAGFTGGDSLSKLKRTLEYIKALKHEFGKEFHIHLYTIPESITHENLKKLYNAGLDEIRVHPNLQDSKNWNKLRLPRQFDWDYGLEIPAIPGFLQQNIKLLDYAKDWISFLNLNELEIADNSTNTLNKLGYFTKSSSSYGVKGSEEAALTILKHCEQNYGFSVHYCPVKLKDKVQLANRIKLRAKSIANPFDKITSNGTLIRGVIYLPGLEPGAKYMSRIKMVENKNPDRNKLWDNFNAGNPINCVTHKSPSTASSVVLPTNKSSLLNQLTTVCKAAGFKEWQLDKRLLRAIVAKKELKKKAKVVKLLGTIPAIIEEYPTWDSFLVEVEFI